jgi:ABC-type transport system involved in multi-copper enzyme maturation permease subunit
MLWYKVWRETRTRFLLIASALSLIFIFGVLIEPHLQQRGIPIPLHVRQGVYSEYIYNLVFAGTAKGLFALLVIFLGLGGLQRERAHNTAVFTLALPVSRYRLIGTQIAVGLLELAALSLLPAALIPALSALTHQSYPLPVALHFSVLWFSGGLVIFAVSFLLSVAAPGEYTAPVACYAALMVHTVIAAWRPLVPYRLSLMWIMGEFQAMHWDAAHNLLLPPPVSWLRISVMALIAFLMFSVAVRITQRQDF